MGGFVCRFCGLSLGGVDTFACGVCEAAAINAVSNAVEGQPEGSTPRGLLFHQRVEIARRVIKALAIRPKRKQ